MSSTYSPEPFSVSGHTYRAEPMSARDAFHVVRVFGPVIEFIGDVRKVAANKSTPDQFVRTMVGAAGPLRREDCDFVIDTCMRYAKREQVGGTWAPARVGDADMFADVGMQEMLLITWHVMERNSLWDFFTAPPGSETSRGA